MTKRDFLTSAMAGGLALAEIRAAFAFQNSSSSSKLARRKAKTTKLFKAPDGFPNALAVTAEGLWIGEQKLSGEQAKAYRLPEPASLTENAWLVDWNGKVLKTVVTPSRNTSGMAVGGGYVWMIANAPPMGVFQVDMNSKLISHRQIPLGPPNDGGGSHGGSWHDGKLWISSLRLRGNLRVDPKTWTPEFMIPFYQAPDRTRYHDITIDNGSMWQVIGNDSTGYKDFRPGLVRYDLATGKPVEIVDFLPGSSDPHGLAMYDGKLISCDAGIHPGWRNYDSPTAGWIFQIDFV
ncbi:MAG: hypothetical protein NZV14_06865 [Bryobacteraceae bacterium]|nr:hypothetical protein [Bryobacteraceae bacterium]MDW8377863.1 hypothetical protein [Bryobacterales bacterium]